MAAVCAGTGQSRVVGRKGRGSTDSAGDYRPFIFPLRSLNHTSAYATLLTNRMSRTPEDIQDELLVLRCQDGDREALEKLIARWQPRLGRLAWRLTARREAAQDIVQDAWLAIVRGLKRLDDPARFRSWAYRIVSNKCADWTRRRVVQRSVANDLRAATASAEADPSSETDSAGEDERIRDALRELPDQQRAILSLHYLDGMGLAEIAEAIDVPVGTVKSRLYHARNRLKETLERTES